ncbi:copper-binding protein [Nitrosomonas communis]
MKLAHGPIASLKWPAMTMNLQIKEHNTHARNQGG